MRRRVALPVLLVLCAVALGAPTDPDESTKPATLPSSDASNAPPDTPSKPAPQTEPPPAPAPYHANSSVPNLKARLEALDPSDPMAYFELGEEVAYEMPILAGQGLARQLYVLAFELDRRSAHPRGIGGSVCLALAELSTDVNEQRWLRALAEALEGAQSDVRWSVALTSGGASDRGPLDLADAMGRARAGDVRQLRTMLSRFDVATMLRDAGMKTEEASDFVGTLEREMARLRAHPPSREVRKVSDGEMVIELEPTSGGNPGPSLTEAEYLEQLRVEMMLLEGRPSSWAGQMLMGGGAPLRDIDPAELAPYFGVDPGRSVFRTPPGGEWRDGSWVKPAAPVSAPDAPASPPSPGAQQTTQS